MAGPATVDEYMAGLGREPRRALDELRQVIRAAAPDATETISYQMPAFRSHGRILVYCGAFSRHCSLFPASMSVIDAFRAELAPYLASKGTIRFPLDQPLPADLVTRIVRARLEENAGPRR